VNLDQLSGQHVATLLQLSALIGEGGMWGAVHREEFGNSILYLMVSPDFSSWHRLKESETWILLGGAPVALHTIDHEHTHRELSHVAENLLLTHTVPTGVWMAAESLGEWSLLACLVTPAFTELELANRDLVDEWSARFGPAVGRFFHE
jgi:predicted cupin superfamily sugar epimerase